jgi:hypothetical protein
MSADGQNSRPCLLFELTGHVYFTLYSEHWESLHTSGHVIYYLDVVPFTILLYRLYWFRNGKYICSLVPQNIPLVLVLGRQFQNLMKH